MQYFGGKARIAGKLAEYINGQLCEGDVFVDAFCGSCNVISKIKPDAVRIANDKHKPLIEMWRALQSGWVPPETISEQEYQAIKRSDDNLHVKGFVGFGCSFAGKWFGGYARCADEKNYCATSKRSVIKKLKNLDGVRFLNKDFTELVIPHNVIVYCDIPYKDTTGYCKKEVGTFDHGRFYSWARKQKARVFVSEYRHNMPDFCTELMTIGSRKSIRNSKGECVDTVEVLMEVMYGE